MPGLEALQAPTGNIQLVTETEVRKEAEPIPLQLRSFFLQGYTSEAQTWKMLFNNPHPDISSLISPIATVLWGLPGDIKVRDPSALPKLHPYLA